MRTGGPDKDEVAGSIPASPTRNEPRGRRPASPTSHAVRIRESRTLLAVKMFRRVLLVLGVAGAVGAIAGCGARARWSRPPKAAERSSTDPSSDERPVTVVLVVGAGEIGTPRRASDPRHPGLCHRVARRPGSVAAHRRPRTRWGRRYTRSSTHPATRFRRTSLSSPVRCRPAWDTKSSRQPSRRAFPSRRATTSTMQSSNCARSIRTRVRRGSRSRSDAGSRRGSRTSHGPRRRAVRQCRRDPRRAHGLGGSGQCRHGQARTAGPGAGVA